MKRQGFAKSMLTTAALAFAIASVPMMSAKAEEAVGTYTVEQGDNLCKISRKVYGSEKFWRLIYNANSGMVKKGYLIYKGQVFSIPAIDGNGTPLAVQNQAIANPAPEANPAPAANPAPEANPAPTAASNPAPGPSASAPAPSSGEAEEYTLDYNAIASWVEGGFIGNDASGSPVVMALDANDDNAIIIFGDNSDMTAVSFVGPITYNGDQATISDTANGMSLTFSVKSVNDTTLLLDMGDIGSAQITAATKEEVLNTIKTAIENYKHIA